MGVYFDYKKKYRNFLLCNLAATVVSLSLALLTYSVYKDVQKNLTIVQVMLFFTSYIFQHFEAATVLTTYVIMIFCLHKRFDSLNTLLR